LQLDTQQTAVPECRGLDNAGKTTIVKRINNEDVNEVSPTLGFNIKSMEYLGFRLNIWDVGGQTTLRSYWKNYFEQTDGLIWVVDSSDRRRLAECGAELHKILMEERLAGASLLIFANKQDVAGALSTEQIADAMRLQYIAGNRHWKIVACSATAGTGVVDGFDWIVKDVGNRVYLLA
jgi:ADP-ribosylation factor-like protein 2